MHVIFITCAWLTSWWRIVLQLLGGFVKSLNQLFMLAYVAKLSPSLKCVCKDTLWVCNSPHWFSSTFIAWLLVIVTYFAVIIKWYFPAHDSAPCKGNISKWGLKLPVHMGMTNDSRQLHICFVSNYYVIYIGAALFQCRGYQDPLHSSRCIDVQPNIVENAQPGGPCIDKYIIYNLAGSLHRRHIKQTINFGQQSIRHL